MKAESICIQPWDKRQLGKDNREHHTTISTINITENEGPEGGKGEKHGFELKKSQLALQMRPDANSMCESWGHMRDHCSTRFRSPAILACKVSASVLLGPWLSASRSVVISRWFR